MRLLKVRARKYIYNDSNEWYWESLSGQCRCSIDDRFDGIPDAECFVPSNLISTFDRTASRTTLSIIIHPLRGWLATPCYFLRVIRFNCILYTIFIIQIFYIFARDCIYFLEIQFAKFYCFCLETLFIKFYNQIFLFLFQDITHSDDPLRTHHLMRPLTRTIEWNVYDIWWPAPITVPRLESQAPG